MVQPFIYNKKLTGESTKHLPCELNSFGDEALLSRAPLRLMQATDVLNLGLTQHRSGLP